MLRRLLTERGALAFGLSWLSVNAVVGVWIQQGPYLLKLPVRSSDQALVGGFGAGQIGGIFAAWGLLFLTGIALWSVLGARLPRRQVLAAALAGMLGVTFTLALVNHGAPRALLGVAAALVLIESGFTPAAFSHLADLTRRVDPARGAALGLYSVLLAAGQLGGNVLGAPFAVRWQMDGVLALTALLGFLALVGVALMPPGGSRKSGDP
jgi:MFS family permease